MFDVLRDPRITMVDPTGGIASDGVGVGYGVWGKWSRPGDKHKAEREAILHVFREIVKTNRESHEQATGGR